MNKKLFKVRFYGDDFYYFAANKKEIKLLIMEREDLLEEEFNEDYRIHELKYDEI